VDNLATHIDWGSEGLQGDLDDVDGANYTGAKAARLKKKNALLKGGAFATSVIGDGIERNCSHSNSIATPKTERIRKARVLIIQTSELDTKFSLPSLRSPEPLSIRNSTTDEFLLISLLLFDNGKTTTQEIDSAE
jgi:hypothetical protein